MPLHIPGRTTEPGAGGLLVVEGRDADVFVRPVIDQAGALQAVNPIQTNSARARFLEFVDVADPDFTAENTDKNKGGLEFAEHTLTVQKYTLIIPVTTELMDDAEEDPFRLVTPRVIQKFAQRLDAEVLGVRNGTDYTSRMDSTLVAAAEASGQVVELGDTPDALEIAVGDALGELEDAGRTGNEVRLILPTDAGRYVREARRAPDGSTDRLYGENDPFQGLQRSVSSNLTRLRAAGDDNGAVAVVVDPSAVRMRIRQSLTIERSEQAAITIGGQLVSLWERNLVAVKFELRAGMVVLDDTGVAIVRRPAAA